MRESAGEAPSGSGGFKCSFAGGSISPASASFSRWTLILCVLNLSLPSCYNPVVGVRGHLDNSRWSHLKSVIELHLQEPWFFFFPKEICIQRFWDLEHDHLILGKPHSLTMMPKSKTLREEMGVVTFVWHRLAFAPSFWLLYNTGPPKIQWARGLHMGTSQETWLFRAMVGHKAPHQLTLLFPELHFFWRLSPCNPTHDPDP